MAAFICRFVFILLTLFKMTEQLDRIKQKLKILKDYDKSFVIFGSLKHKYKLNPALSLYYIKNFETTHGINLPEELTKFLTTIGNGGAGPFYGLESLQDMLYVDLDYKQKNKLLNPSEPFPHNREWNLKFEPSVNEEEDEAEYERQLENFEQRYYDPSFMNGTLAICNFGCAVSINLVVNGPEYGYIWTDDRASDGGIHPSMELGNKEKVQFLDWYELWLDNSLNQLGITTADINNNKPRWKFW
jgi:hypothetical protein